MATLVFSAAGAALGAGFGGTVLGLSGAVIGRAVGATLGRAIDQRILGGGAAAVETPRIDRLRLTNAAEGGAIAQPWGRMRLGGQVIWASEFEEHANHRRGGKGSGPSVTEYSYAISLALGLCQGPILGLGRIWADGAEIAPDRLALRLYHGTEDQLPDPKIAAIEGADRAPAYRGLAYLVIEDLDLAPYGNRVPQFTFEVIREAEAHGPGGTFGKAVQAVAMIPGTGEYALATTPVHRSFGYGQDLAINSNTPSGKTDFVTSLEALTQELPNCRSVSLVVAWFGDDLRCGQCRIQPRVERQDSDGIGMPWQVAGLGRADAGLVPMNEGRPVYGGTPTDASVIEAIRALRSTGQEVMFYPFILMDQQPGNTLPNPWTGGSGQPVMPWRGRITTMFAPGVAGSTDRGVAAAAEVTAFFGSAMPGDFSRVGTRVVYSGPEEWRFRRFILHYAHLAAAAGGVDAFCIGSEMVALTRIRDGADGFPAVAALRQLAAEVRAILGPDCKISYAADWTEYGSYAIDGDLHFPLDPLWADPEIDFIGIDNYMPLADWREGTDHADASWGAIYNLAYLRSNIGGGEGFDWYYDSPEGEAAQIRHPITDGAYGEPWVFRVKDLKNWWSLPHHPRVAGLRAADPTLWQPGSKPIRFTEYGCAAIDKGANHPNRFLDLHSSESALPRASDGRRDDLMQMQYYRAMAEFWADPMHNPQAVAYSGPMVQMDYAHAWAWDARPWPVFPARKDLWADGAVYRAGHWLNGRATHQPLDAVIREIARDLPPDRINTDRLFGLVRGYHLDQIGSARAALQPLMLAHGFDAAERDGVLHFISRRAGVDHVILPDDLAIAEGAVGAPEWSRQGAADQPSVMRLGHIEADGDFTPRVAEVRQPDAAQIGVSLSEVPMALTHAEAQGIAARWLAEARIGRDGLRLALPPSRREVGPGDRLLLPDLGQFRVEQVEDLGPRLIEAVRIEGGVYAGADIEDPPPILRPFVAPVPLRPVFLDLPLLTGAEEPHQPHVAVAAAPWPGAVALWSAGEGEEFALNRMVLNPARIGVTETALPAARPGIWDRGAPLRLRLAGGVLRSMAERAVLSGQNVMAIGPGTLSGGNSADWELFQFAEAKLVAPRVWELRLRLRGQQGSDGIMPPVWPAGSTVVLLDAAVVQLDLAPHLRGLYRRYRMGSALRGIDDPLVHQTEAAFDGVGLRPWPICHLRLSHSGGSHGFRWIRRTRLDGDNWQQFEVPLGEEREAYLLRILRAGVIQREILVDAPYFTYAAADRLADGISAGYRLAVAQLSDRFGPGPFRHIDVP